ncbi:hypothetical protein SAV14893_072900 [Streptomyces avermitilis]|uniref:SsgA family sporulation/cell division regulator n=1 Tax=Streptomyces avermitilis TaxID=33903 RepID=A0A4D4M8L6_STRAX|nr:hypothetical protein SAV14893_072900 [Streptomyces avermitilis]
MIPSVHKTLVMQLKAGGSDRFPVLTHLSYDASDPFAVAVSFSHEGRVLARWSLDREMLAEGIRRPVGEGTYAFDRSPPADGRSCAWSSSATRIPTAAATTR